MDKKIAWPDYFMSNIKSSHKKLLRQAAKETHTKIMIFNKAYCQDGQLLPGYVSVYRRDGINKDEFWGRYHELVNEQCPAS